MSLWDSVKEAFGMDVHASATISFPDMLVAGGIFVIIMYVANMFFPGDRKKLLSIALLAILFLYVFFWL